MVVALLLGRFRDTGRMALILYAHSRRPILGVMDTRPAWLYKFTPS
jgi:hypothetical protein